MADGRFIADTLETVIVGLADSLVEASEQLSAVPPLDAHGRPAPQYRLPHLDFQISFRLVTQTTQDGRRAILFFSPLASSTSTTEVASTVSGRFVAVPPGDGAPLPVLSLSTTGTGSTRELTVQASNSAGELLAGAVVQLNVDLAASQALSAAAGVTDARIAGGVGFASAVLTTDDTGRASTEITFADQLRVGAVVLVTAELGTTLARLTTGKAL